MSPGNELQRLVVNANNTRSDQSMNTFSVKHMRCLAIGSATLVAVLASGCMLEQGDAGPSGEESVSSGTDALVVDTTLYSWVQGSGETILGPGAGYSGSTHTCFITKVRGNFRGGGEFVKTYITTPVGGGVGTWRLTGGSQQSGVGAEAVCVEKPPLAEAVWNQGLPAASLQTNGGDVFCGFTLVKGNFAGTGEHLNIAGNYNVSPPAWSLFGSSQQQGVGARARCIAAHQSTPAPGSVTYSKGTDLWPLGSGVFGGACVLGVVQGPFRGSGDNVRIAKAASGYWQLLSSGANGAARCAE